MRGRSLAAASADAAPGAFAPSPGAAAFAASLRRWSLTMRAEFDWRDACVQRLHAFLERRMRGEPRRVEFALQLGRAAGEEHMRDIDGAFVFEPRAGRIRRHHDEGALQRLRIARELHRRCIGEMLTAPRDGGLQQAADQRARTAGNKNAERNELHTARRLCRRRACS